jgi:hypothetical protein
MELSKQEYLDKFSLCAYDQDVQALEKIKAVLVKERTVMDRWFDKYLEMFERKMSTEDTETPIWKLYKTKSKEYSELNGIIKTADIYIKKFKSV